MRFRAAAPVFFRVAVVRLRAEVVAFFRVLAVSFRAEVVAFLRAASVFLRAGVVAFLRVAAVFLRADVVAFLRVAAFLVEAVFLRAEPAFFRASPHLRVVDVAFLRVDADLLRGVDAFFRAEPVRFRVPLDRALRVDDARLGCSEPSSSDSSSPISFFFKGDRRRDPDSERGPGCGTMRCARRRALAQRWAADA